MFTGLIQELGKIRSACRRGGGKTLDLATGMQALVPGESVAVDGVCLTVGRLLAGGFEAFASNETLERTTLRLLAAGDRVHLERAIRLGERLGGHVVTGHIDGVGRVARRRPAGDSVEMRFEVPEALAPFLAPKGSIAVNGTSLTLNQVDGRSFDVVLVPFTRGATTFDSKRTGSQVNIEVDVIAKYIARLLGRPGVDARKPGASTGSQDSD